MPTGDKHRELDSAGGGVLVQEPEGEFGQMWQGPETLPGPGSGVLLDMAPPRTQDRYSHLLIPIKYTKLGSYAAGPGWLGV